MLLTLLLSPLFFAFFPIIKHLFWVPVRIRISFSSLWLCWITCIMCVFWKYLHECSTFWWLWVWLSFSFFFFWLSLQLIGTWGCGRQRFACMHVRKSNFLLSREFPTRLFKTMRYPEIACREFQKEQGILKILFPWPSEELLLKIPVLFFFLVHHWRLKSECKNITEIC